MACLVLGTWGRSQLLHILSHDRPILSTASSLSWKKANIVGILHLPLYTYISCTSAYHKKQTSYHYHCPTTARRLQLSFGASRKKKRKPLTVGHTWDTGLQGWWTPAKLTGEMDGCPLMAADQFHLVPTPLTFPCCISLFHLCCLKFCYWPLFHFILLTFVPWYIWLSDYTVTFT